MGVVADVYDTHTHTYLFIQQIIMSACIPGTLLDTEIMMGGREGTGKNTHKIIIGCGLWREL